MPLDFPNAPIVGQVYTAEGQYWAWDGSAWHVTSGDGGLTQAQADARYLQLTGGTLTGALILPAAAPTLATHAASKGYVDGLISALPAPPTVPAFATTAEALTGIVTDKVMSPALVQARSGAMVTPSLVGLTSVTLSDIPPEANEIDLTFDYMGPDVITTLITVRPNNLNVGYVSNQMRVVSTGTVTQSEATTGFVVDMPAATDNLTGILRLTRGFGATRWVADGRFRIASTKVVNITGTLIVDNITSVVIGSSAAFVKGLVSLRWRI